MELAIFGAAFVFFASLLGARTPEVKPVKDAPRIVRVAHRSVENPIRLYSCQGGHVVEERGLDIVLIQDENGPIPCAQKEAAQERAELAPEVIIEPEMGPNEAICPKGYLEIDSVCTDPKDLLEGSQT